MVNKGNREHLQTVAQLARNADGVVEEGLVTKFFQRAPFVWTVLGIFALAAADQGILHYRVGQIERLSKTYENENFPETIRNNKAYIDLLKSDRGVGILEQLHNQRRQIRKINGLPDEE